MRLKSHFVYENKTIFVYFLTISGILHLIFIFSTSSLSNLLKPELNYSDYGTKESDYVIEIDLGKYVSADSLTIETIGTDAGIGLLDVVGENP